MGRVPGQHRPLPPRAADRASEEALHDLQITVVDGKLHTSSWGRTPEATALTPLARDVFAIGGGAIRFERSTRDKRGRYGPSPSGGWARNEARQPAGQGRRSSPREALAGACAARMLAEARLRGLQPERREVLRAFYNYLINAVIMTYRVARDDDPGGERWVEVAMHAANLMTAVALGDEGVFDSPVPEMSAGERRDWLNGVARYLGAAARGRDAARPHGPAAREIDAIARLWRETHARFGDAAHPAVLAGWCGALVELYGANVAELDPAVE